MQPNNPNSHHDPYAFITDPGNTPKKPLFGGGSKMSKIFLVLAGVTLLVIIMAVVASLGGGGVNKQDYVSLLQQQTEIMRIASLGETDADSEATKNFAVNTRLTLASQKTELTALATAANAKIDPKTLALGVNAATDKQLADAQQLNKYDQVFTDIIKLQLATYQEAMGHIYEGTKAEASRATLEDAYNSVGILIGPTAQGASSSGAPKSTPDTN